MMNSTNNIVPFQKPATKQADRPSAVPNAKVRSLNAPRFGRDYTHEIRYAPSLQAKVGLITEQFLLSIIPTVSLPNIEALTPTRLKHLGDVRGVIFDLDDTLMPLLSGKFPEPVLDTLKNLQAAGFKMGIVTNNIQPEYCRNARKQLKEAGLHIPFIEDARKPDPIGFATMRDHLGLKSHQVAVVGDGYICDIRCANQLNMLTVQATWFSRNLFGNSISYIQDTIAASFHCLRTALSAIQKPTIIDPLPKTK